MRKDDAGMDEGGAGRARASLRFSQQLRGGTRAPPSGPTATPTAPPGSPDPPEVRLQVPSLEVLSFSL